MSLCHTYTHQHRTLAPTYFLLHLCFQPLFRPFVHQSSDLPKPLIEISFLKCVAQLFQFPDNLFAFLSLPHISGEMPHAPSMHKVWISVYFLPSRIEEPMVSIGNHANLPCWPNHYLSYMHEKPTPTVILLPHCESEAKGYQLVVRIIRRGNHQNTLVSSCQESGIHTNYRSAVLECFHCLRKSPENTK